MMLIPYRFQPVHISRIDRCDHRFLITKEKDLKTLVSSIDETGLINPPLLYRKKDKFIIVSGFRRVEALRSIGLDEIASRVIDEGVSRVDCIKIAVTDNLSRRTLNIIEQSRVCRMLLDVFDEERQLIRTSVSFGLPGSLRELKRIGSICAMNSRIQDGLYHGFISLPVALELGKMEMDIALAFTDLFRQINTGINKQREILGLVMEICARDDLDIALFLSSNDIRDIVTDNNIDAPRKAGNVLSCLRKMRFPSIVSVQNNFDAALKQLKLGKGIHINPSKYFEKGDYTITLTVKNQTDLADRRKEIDKILKNPELFNCTR